MTPEGQRETGKQKRQREVREAKPVWWAYLAIFLASLTLSGAALLISVHYADNSSKKWCEIVITMDDAYSQPRPAGSPPLTATGQKLARDMRHLRQSLGCD